MEYKSEISVIYKKKRLYVRISGEVTNLPLHLLAEYWGMSFSHYKHMR